MHWGFIASFTSVLEHGRRWQFAGHLHTPKEGLSQTYAKMQRLSFWGPAKQSAVLVVLSYFMFTIGRLGNGNRSQAQTRGTATSEMVLTLISLILH